MIRILIFSALIVALLPACSSVDTQYNSATDFSALQSFAWKTPPHQNTENAALSSELFGRIVSNATVSILEAHNYQLAKPKTADFLVTYHIEQIEEEVNSSVAPRFGFGMGQGGSMPQKAVENGGAAIKKMGVLSIIVINANNGKEIWRGSRSKELTQEHFAKEGVTATVKEILESFPPEK